MSFYECTYIARQDLSSAQVEAITDKVVELVKESGGTVHGSEYWGLRQLAYRIRKNRKGHYTMLKLEIDGKFVSELERRMRINEDILRYLTVRVDELDEAPSPMMKRRGREDRGNRSFNNEAKEQNQDNDNASEQGEN